MLNNIATILNCVAIIVASVAAICGINSWKKESKWKKKNELAEELLYLFYECRDGISRIRSPMSWGGEGKSRLENPGETPELKESLDKAYVVKERYDRNGEIFNKLLSLKYRALLYFGTEAETSIKDISKIINKIFSAADMLGSFYWLKKDNPQEIPDYPGWLKEKKDYEKILWSRGKDDEISKEVSKAIENAEKVLKKWIR